MHTIKTSNAHEARRAKLAQFQALPTDVTLNAVSLHGVVIAVIKTETAWKVKIICRKPARSVDAAQAALSTTKLLGKDAG